MKTRVLPLLIGAAVFLFATAAFSHHSLAGTYVLDQSKTIEGTVIDFVMRNPHSFVTVEVQDAAGNAQRWGIEWAGTTVLRNAGIDPTSLKVGEKVSIMGNAARDTSERKLLMQRIERPGNGLIWEGIVGNRSNPTQP